MRGLLIQMLMIVSEMQNLQSISRQDDGNHSGADEHAAVPMVPAIAPGAALESFQRLLEEFADALNTTKRDEQSSACTVHAGVQAGSTGNRASKERQGSGVRAFVSTAFCDS